jgi:streptogramin lyase
MRQVVNRKFLAVVLPFTVALLLCAPWQAHAQSKGTPEETSTRYIAKEIRTAWNISDDAGLARRADFVADKIILFRVPLSSRPNENTLVDSSVWANAWRSEAELLRRFRPDIHQTNVTVIAKDEYEVVESGISRWTEPDGREASSKWEITSTVSNGKIIVVRGIVAPPEYK